MTVRGIAAEFINGRALPRTESGSAMVELAVVVCLLIPVFFGFIDYGVQFREQSVMVEAARIGARAGGMQALNTPPGTIATVATNTAAEYLRRSGLDLARYAIEVSPDTIEYARGTANQRTIQLIKVSVSRTSSSYYVLPVHLYSACVRNSFALAGANASANTVAVSVRDPLKGPVC